jgi:uncharacterized membrane protein YfcA
MSFADSLSAFSPLLFLAIAAVFLLAGLVKGVVGLGLPTVCMALLAVLMTPAQAAALLIVPSLVTNLWQIWPWRTLGPLLRRIAPMQVGVCIGTWIGAWALGAPHGAWAGVALGVVLVVYALWGLFGSPPKVPAQAEGWLGPLVGVLTGLVTAATGVFVVPAVPYLQSLGLSRDGLIQAMGVSFSVSTLALALGLAFNGSYSGGEVGASLLMLAPALAGMYLGQHLRGVLSPALFRLCFFGSLILLGLYQLGGELWG